MCIQGETTDSWYRQKSRIKVLLPEPCSYFSVLLFPILSCCVHCLGQPGSLSGLNTVLNLRKFWLLVWKENLSWTQSFWKSMQNLHRLCSNYESFCIHCVTQFSISDMTLTFPLSRSLESKTNLSGLSAHSWAGSCSGWRVAVRTVYLHRITQGQRGLAVCQHCCRPGEGNDIPILILPCISDRAFILQHL